jgi:hypothetical protein
MDREFGIEPDAVASVFQDVGREAGTRHLLPDHVYVASDCGFIDTGDPPQVRHRQPPTRARRQTGIDIGRQPGLQLPNKCGVLPVEDLSATVLEVEQRRPPRSGQLHRAHLNNRSGRRENASHNIERNDLGKRIEVGVCRRSESRGLAGVDNKGFFERRAQSQATLHVCHLRAPPHDVPPGPCAGLKTRRLGR